ncbi:hypothetical protein [Actinomadura sp. WMMB 499]|uniref:hypothetical protein n=1 Tax=Actinomadura sp. WMMB 499 TaxID=1219491 RepID=UPI001246BB6D|nr:hypothetical protein [Actinomadura sp. WMMB 499]QFG25475.1 hypothetical protein F7P10_34360 [Actinomadura sp. WMMB 499]
MKLTDWRGNEYGVGSIVLYSQYLYNQKTQVLEGEVVDITNHSVIIRVIKGSSYTPNNERLVCKVRRNITALEG